MFAIAFDMDIKELRNAYGEPYNNAYYDEYQFWIL